MKGRYLSINCIIRKYQIETNRTEHLLEDETELHDAQSVINFSDAVRKGFPDANITWALSWQALTDDSPRYQEIKETLKQMRERYGDEVTFIPGGFFGNVHNSREQLNQDMRDALEIIENTIGYRPASIVAGFCSAHNIRYAAENLGINALQGNVWSQYSIDAQDGDGSIAYPYYPSTQHFCKPAQGSEDFIDCLNLDGWTVDLVAARSMGDYWENNERFVSRMGVGPIETLHTFGAEKGLWLMQKTTEAHFCEENIRRNPFGWVTVNYEISEVNRAKHLGALEAFGEWAAWIKRTWKDAQCPNIAEFGAKIKQHYPDNRNLSYLLHQKGSGVGASFGNQEVTWLMNQAFRLGILNEDGKRYVFDYTDYRKTYQEPQEEGQRNWTLFGAINQKRTRPQDQPVSLDEYAHWDTVREVIAQKYDAQELKKLLPEI